MGTNHFGKVSNRRKLRDDHYILQKHTGGQTPRRERAPLEKKSGKRPVCKSSALLQGPQPEQPGKKNDLANPGVSEGLQEGAVH